MRTQASKGIEKKFYKRMSIACWGKTLENHRQRGTKQLVETEAQVGTFKQPATIEDYKIISDNHVSASFRASSVVWSKPAPVGATISNFSNLS